MIIGVGIDVVHVERIRRWRHIEGLYDRFFHPEELASALPRGEVGILSLAARFAAKLQLEIADPPEGISIKSFATGLDATELILQCSAETRLGTKGNLIINAFNARTDPEKDKRQARRAPLATLPAIPFEVVGAR